MRAQIRLTWPGTGCRIIFSNNNVRLPFSICRSSQAPTTHAAICGFTLPEILIAVGISGVVLAAVAVTTITAFRNFAAMYNYTDLNLQSHLAMDLISRDVRGASSATPVSANVLKIANSVSGVTITFTYDPDDKTLVSEVSGQPEHTLLSHCDSWSYTFYQRTPTTDYDNTSTTVSGLCKVISMKWQCSRTIMGKVS